MREKKTGRQTDRNKTKEIYKHRCIMRTLAYAYTGYVHWEHIETMTCEWQCALQVPIYKYYSLLKKWEVPGDKCLAPELQHLVIHVMKWSKVLKTAGGMWKHGRSKEKSLTLANLGQYIHQNRYNRFESTK